MEVKWLRLPDRVRQKKRAETMKRCMLWVRVMEGESVGKEETVWRKEEGGDSVRKEETMEVLLCNEGNLNIQQSHGKAGGSKVQTQEQQQLQARDPRLDYGKANESHKI
ncbi:hypothetical protein RJT34_32665 [Clitoria ternatea]|uniref:Uncharacterized protein n=1 Tax=Clitoria ternatea TaxID=43366 RepID=A0AAN9EWI3_CLITE